MCFHVVSYVWSQVQGCTACQLIIYPDPRRPSAVSPLVSLLICVASMLSGKKNNPSRENIPKSKMIHAENCTWDENKYMNPS